MSPTLYDEPTTSERLLVALHPLFGWLARHWPSRFGVPAPRPPHPSAMVAEHNWIWKLIFPHFFTRIQTERASIEELRNCAARSTVVYVAKNIGQLEYHYFNHLFQQEGLPLAHYSNALTLRRWMHWTSYWDSVITEEHEITDQGRPSDPLMDGLLPQRIATGESVLVALPPSGLADEGLFLIGPVRALTALIEAQRISPKPISIVPLDFVWSRRPEKATRSVIDILFGEKENPGAIRKIALFWRNYNNRAQAVIGHPIDLSTFVQWEGGDDLRLALRLRESLMEALRTHRRTITGPPIRPRRWFIQEVTGDAELDDEICRIAAAHGKHADDVRELAERYAREIAADPDYTVIELLDRILSPIFRRIFDSFQVDETGLSRAKELAATGPIVFVPNHKSHADYLLLSLVLYHHGMTVPHIAAGINLEFWPLGPIFRRGGAYFIRRAFRNNQLYRAVLETYLKILLREGYSQEFFIEGGRSRTGKLLRPRKGMLSMLHSAAGRAGIASMHFIPVSITYDRVIEQKSYERELEGGAKQKERSSHLLGLTKFLRRQRHRYGSLYIRFGEPIAAARGKGDSATMAKISSRICHEINRCIVATPAAVAAAVLLSGARRGVTREEFRQGWKAMLGALTEKGVEISTRITATPDAAMDEAVALLVQVKLVSPHTDAAPPFFAIEEGKRIPLSFYKNSIVHFLVSAGVVAALLLKSVEADGPLARQELVAGVEIGRRLLAQEFRFASRRTMKEHVERAVRLLLGQNAVVETADARLAIPRESLPLCRVFASQVLPFLETLLIAFRHVTERMTGASEERTLINEMLRTGQDLILLDYVRYREAVTKTGMENALRTLTSFQILFKQEAEGGVKGRDIYTLTQDPTAVNTLKAELEKFL